MPVRSRSKSCEPLRNAHSARQDQSGEKPPADPGAACAGNDNTTRNAPRTAPWSTRAAPSGYRIGYVEGSAAATAARRHPEGGLSSTPQTKVRCRQFGKKCRLGKKGGQLPA